MAAAVWKNVQDLHREQTGCATGIRVTIDEHTVSLVSTVPYLCVGFLEAALVGYVIIYFGARNA
jgi:hypothetical protein